MSLNNPANPLKVSGDTGTSGVTTVPVKAPIGCIVWWSGTVMDIPTGWHICDSTGGTVDLRDKFILAAGTNHAVGDTGGSEEVTLTVDQMPTHNHGIDTNIGRFFEGTNSAYMLGITGDTSSTNNAGSSQPHPNMPPYYTLIAIQKIAADETDVAEVSFDDTMRKNADGSYGVTLPVKSITQAEYNALTDKSGFYIITDAEDGTSDPNVYSKTT